MPRLSKLFSSKEKEALAEAEARRSSGASSSPPPEYQQQPPPEYDAEHALHPPDITAGFSKLSLDKTNADGVPTVDETIAHLKVLECFYRLRQKVGSADGLFGIHDSIVTGCETVTGNDKAELLAKLAEKRWAIYLARAVDRFHVWVSAVAPSTGMPSMAEINTHGKAGQLTDRVYLTRDSPTFRKSNMPPADVLMVWHSYMLNPRAYLEDCIRYGRMHLWHTKMPWKAASECINSETFAFEAGSDAEATFTSLTDLPWYNVQATAEKEVTCPGCNTGVRVPWTTCFEYPQLGTWKSKEDVSTGVDTFLQYGHGFCDRDFRASCPTCATDLDHACLKAGKFRRDIKRLLDDNVPMAGTLLGDLGFPFKAGVKQDFFLEDATNNVNGIISKGLGKKILAQPITADDRLGSSMDGIRTMIDEALEDKTYIRSARASLSHKLTRHERILVRKMMSRYWENSSPFALDLVGAVLRQGGFIEKMHNIDWLHSPALPSTMGRLITKYKRFVHIMVDDMHMAVPTLDVDLAWHTHQLSPYFYFVHTVTVCKQFVDHDDKVAETKLNDAFAWTSKTYQKMFGEPYSECTCWYCEAIRESTTTTVGRLFNSRSSKANNQLHDVEQDPRKSVHISAHNAVRPTDDTNEYQTDAKKKADQLEEAYKKACARAVKKGRKPPPRNDYYYSDAYGYPVYIPAYSPYIGYYPYSPLYYGYAPACMNVGMGAAGNCCVGTCGGAAAAGACSASGGGACAGGMGGGGCGGGGVGGAACGGGGGGGCGGGGGGGGC